MRLSSLRTVMALVSMLALSPRPAEALLLREYRKLGDKEATHFLLGAVSMVAYTRASNSDTKGARCVQDYFFGPTAHPEELVKEIATAERLDPDRYLVEGLILGFTDKVCPNAQVTR